MSTRASHLQAANRNESALQYLLIRLDDHPEWVATVAFYKALHLVEAMFSTDPHVHHTWDHRARRDALKADPRYDDIYRRYSKIARASMIARYLSESHRGATQYGTFTDFMPAREVSRCIVDVNLRELENLIQKETAGRP